MKLFLSLILIALSILLAFLKTSELKQNLKNSCLLFKLSEKIKNNFNSEMRSVHMLSEDYINENYSKNVSFSSSDELINYIKSEFSALPYISDYITELSKIPTISSDELSDCCKKLIAIAENGYTDTLTQYKKDSKNAYILFPGIISIFILILL